VAVSAWMPQAGKKKKKLKTIVSNLDGCVGILIVNTVAPIGLASLIL